MHGQEENRVEAELPEPVVERSAAAERAGRRAGILAGLTIGALVVTAVATGDPTPTVVSFA